MTNNPILDEIHLARREILLRYKGDTAAYLRDAQARLAASGRPIWRGQQKALPKHATLYSGKRNSNPPTPEPQ